MPSRIPKQLRKFVPRASCHLKEALSNDSAFDGNFKKTKVQANTLLKSRIRNIAQKNFHLSHIGNICPAPLSVCTEEVITQISNVFSAKSKQITISQIVYDIFESLASYKPISLSESQMCAPRHCDIGPQCINRLCSCSMRACDKRPFAGSSAGCL